MSADGASFEFRGVDFADYGVYVVSRRWPRLPEPRVDVRRFAQADGGATQGNSFEMRSIALECAMVATNEANRNTQAANVAAALANTQLGMGPLVIDYFPTLQFNARLVKGVDVELAQAGELFSLEFLADPWPTAISASSDDDNTIDGTTQALFAPEGVRTVDAVWLVKNSGDDAASVTLANATTGDTAVWANTLPGGNWLRMTSQTQKFEVSDDSGETWTEVPANTSGRIPRVSGGQQNDITLTGLADGTWDLSYTAGYLQ